MSTSMAIKLRNLIFDGKSIKSVTQAAEILRISRPCLSNVLNGKADLSIELAAKIEDAFGYSAFGLLESQLKEHLRDYRKMIGSRILPVCKMPTLSKVQEGK